MKTNFLKIKLLPLLLFALGMFTLASCDKDDDTTPDTIKDQIVGTWDFVSYKLDTSEYIGVIADSAFITFDTMQGNQGNFEQTIYFADEQPESLTGKYEVDEKKKELKLIADGETEVMKITHIGNKNLYWTGTQDGYAVAAKTLRRE